MRVFGDADIVGPSEGSQSARPWVLAARSDHQKPPTKFIVDNDTKDLAHERCIPNAAGRWFRARC